MAASCGDVAGITRTIIAEGESGSSGIGGVDGGHAVGGGDGVGHGRELLRRGVAVDLGHGEERPVEAGAEALGEQVVRLAGRGVLAVVALVGEAEPQ